MSGVAEIKDVAELKNRINTKTLNLFLLTVATAGIYPILWLYSNYAVIDSITKKRTADNVFVIWIAICAGLGSSLAGLGDDILDVIALLLTLALKVLYIVWAFKAKSALQEYALNEHQTDLKMNGFYTFIFTIYYINYCINDMPEIKHKNMILNGDENKV